MDESLMPYLSLSGVKLRLDLLLTQDFSEGVALWTVEQADFELYPLSLLVGASSHRPLLLRR